MATHTPKHSPLPWKVNIYSAKYQVVDTNAPDHKEERKKLLEDLGKNIFDALSIGTDHGQICIVPLDESNLESANFICTACNNHYELLEALEGFLETVGKHEYPATAAIAIKAIDKARRK